MHPVIYMRNERDFEVERAAAAQHFPVVSWRTDVPRDALVIPRYSALPFNADLAHDVRTLGSELINTHAQHVFVANLLNWVELLGELTPRTWTTWNDLPADKSFVVKGTTNSRKSEWSRRMFAKTRADVPRIANSLLDDELLAEQRIVVREFVPLRTFGKGLNEIPISNEWRVFFLDGQVVDAGFYWATEPQHEWDGVDDDDARAADAFVTHPDRDVDWKTEKALEGEAPLPRAARECALEAVRRIGDRIRFVVVDVAERADGGWLVVELNDGQQSGLSMIPPVRFYRNLAAALTRVA